MLSYAIKELNSIIKHIANNIMISFSEVFKYFTPPDSNNICNQSHIIPKRNVF